MAVLTFVSLQLLWQQMIRKGTAKDPTRVQPGQVERRLTPRDNYNRLIYFNWEKKKKIPSNFDEL